MLKATDRSVLVVDDHDGTRTALRVLLGRAGWRVQTAPDGRQALAMLDGGELPDIALVDLNLGDIDGLAVLERARARGLARRCLMISAESNVPAAVEAMRRGARDFLVKPIEPTLLLDRMRHALAATRGCDSDPGSIWRDRHAPNIVGCDAGLLQLLRMLERVATTDCAVQLLGEVGTGKRLVAGTIHRSSLRRAGPLVTVDCRAPAGELEALLFARSGGRVAAAHGGTLYLEEAGRLPAGLRERIAGALTPSLADPLRPRAIDARLIVGSSEADAASEEAALVDAGSAVSLRLPALRERPGDIDRLAEHFLRQACERLGRPSPGYSDAALARLRAHPWPGNVAELEALVDGLTAQASLDGPVTDDALRDKLPRADAFTLAGPSSRPPLELPERGLDLRQLLGHIERELIEQALDRCAGNRSQAAKLLGLKRTTLVEKLRRR